MSEGTIVDGRVELDVPSKLPTGTRVRLEVADDDLKETFEEHMAKLRQSIADMDAGVPGYTVDEAKALMDDEIRKLKADAECRH
jgi:hypothetical protein